MAEKVTLANVRKMLDETFRKWHASYNLTFVCDARQIHRSQFGNDRAAIVMFQVLGMPYKKITAKRSLYPITNALMLAKAFELVRMAGYREVDKEVFGILSLMYKEPTPQPQPQAQPHQPQQPLRTPYSDLYIAERAPLEVAEAAYRALAKKHHPDLGGDAETMKRINAAIEKIRSFT